MFIAWCKKKKKKRRSFWQVVPVQVSEVLSSRLNNEDTELELFTIYVVLVHFEVVLILFSDQHNCLLCS